MILTDAGPLTALINRNDPHHRACVSAASRLPAEPLLTTWPCFTEAMYLLFNAGGHRAQAELWRWRKAGRLVLHDVSDHVLYDPNSLRRQFTQFISGCCQLPGVKVLKYVAISLLTLLLSS